jgi:peptide deformylase
LARILQHEIDHLDGILFVDHLSPSRRLLLGNKLKKIARGSGD